MRVATNGIGISGLTGGAAQAVLIAGPTASGKSALALRTAEARGGVVVNADSMQVYSVLDVLTARPSADEMRRVPHRLYGHVDPAEPYSTGAWLADVGRLLSDPGIAGKPLVFVGGTGLYFRALLGGLSAMPDIPDTVRQRWRYRLTEEGASGLHRMLRRQDPDAAMAIKPADGQRIVRALEVLEVSGRSILDWQAERGAPLVDPATAKRIIIEPDRAWLARRIEARFDAMLANGAVGEVRALLARGLAPAMPAMKAIGVGQLRRAIAGEISLDEAATLAKTASRQYAKRQMTWFRTQCGNEWTRMAAGANGETEHGTLT
ncbi:MAG: tRNA (adenosine(37)-N6)-dimethylallyltransferase MiaA [Rhizobiaceae bacterium]